MRKSSQNAGCMRRWLRSPAGASHCCHERVLVCTSTAADAWVSPAASRASRTCSGVGFEAGLFGPRFGWLDIELKSGALRFFDGGDDVFRGVSEPGAATDKTFEEVVDIPFVLHEGTPFGIDEGLWHASLNGGQGGLMIAGEGEVIGFNERVALGDAVNIVRTGERTFRAGGFLGPGSDDRTVISNSVDRAACGFESECHFRLQPLIPRRGGLRCASHELNYTRNARKRKNYLKLFFGERGETAKPSNAGIER